MFRLLTPERGIIAGILLQSNELGKDKRGDNVQNDDKFNKRSWWDSFRSKLQFDSLGGSKPQINADQKSTETYIKVEKENAGWERVKKMFARRDSLSPELNFVVFAAELGIFTGFITGGLREYAKQVSLFLYTNDAQVYLNVNQAKAALARSGAKGFFKGGCQSAPKCGILFGIFATVCSAVSVYRGKNGILEYAIAGGATTAAMKCNLGIRGMFSGFVTGGLSGTIIGSLFYVFNKIMNTDYFSIRNYVEIISLMHEDLDKSTVRDEFLSDYEKYHYERTKDLPIGFSD